MLATCTMEIRKIGQADKREMSRETQTAQTNR